MRRLALDPMDVPAVQAWLEDWAARGWYLELYGRSLVKFVQGEKRENVRYRLQPVRGEAGVPDQDTREAYREMGWTFVCATIASWSVSSMEPEFRIWRCDDPAAPELDTDQALRREEYDVLLRRRRRDLLVLVPTITLILGVILLGAWVRPREYLLERGDSGTTLFLGLYVLTCLHVVSRTARLVRFTRRLRSEEPAPQRGSWRRAWARAWARAWLFEGLRLLVILVMIVSLFHFNGSRRHYLPVSQYDEPVPYVSLAELGTPAEGEAEALDFHSVWGKSVWWTMEGDYEHLEEDDDGPRCSTEYYSLRIPYMAVNLEAQMLKRWSNVMDAGDRPEQAAVPGADSAWYWRDDAKGWQFLLLRRGGQVLDASYLGEADLLEHADKYVEMLERVK